MATSIRQLEAFKAVVETGSMTGASKMLEVSQPAISRLIASFSATIGVPLFERTAGKLTPTKEARFLLEEANRLLDGIKNFENLAKDVHLRKSGHLKIACLPGFATTLLPRTLSHFMSSRPGITLSLEPDRPERIFDWIIGKQYDVGITGAFSGHPSVIHENLHVRTVCILPKGHSLCDRSEISPEDLRNERLAHPKQTSAFYQSLDAEFTARGVPINTLAVIRQFGTACLMVAAGAGVSIVAETDAIEYESHGLVIRPFTPQIPYQMAIMYAAHAPSSLIGLEFIECFTDAMSPFLIKS